MKYLIIFILIISCFKVQSQTQSELNANARAEFLRADSPLNASYKKIISENSIDTVFINNLKISQQIWITFRDAELKVKFPNREPGYYGSIHPMCVSLYMAELTNDRLKTLSNWVIGIEEGDACSGTIKNKDE